MKDILKTISTYLLAVLLFLLTFVAGYFTHDYLNPTAAKFTVFNEVYRLIDEHGYEPMPEPPAMEYGAVRGLVDAYGDPHTHFSEPARAELQEDTLSGSYGGIGAELARDADGYVVLHPFPDSPASEAGLLDGDRLLQVDDLPITPETPMEEVVAAVRGPEGQKVTLTIVRPPDGDEMTFTVKRASIPLPSVTWNLDPVDPLLGVVRVNVIASSTPDEITNAVADLQERGATRFALDLRGNGGGLLEEGVDIARLFLKDGVVIHRQEKGGDVETYEVKKVGALADIPLAVLVDGGTASASEIIAGAIQAHERAPLIGVPTYGKDSIQSVFDLPDHSSLAVTSAKWWVPGLPAPVGEGGLQPDITVSLENSENADPFLEAVRSYFSENPIP
jgi:carboxyl-terminal processing protease